MAPFLTCSAISFIRSVPSSSFIIERKKNHAIPNATTLAIGISQKTKGMLFITVCLSLIKDIVVYRYKSIMQIYKIY